MEISPFLVRALKTVTIALFLCGILLRLWSMFGEPNRIFYTFTSEDGYLMQTIARNIAIGKGMTVSDGEVPTNGTQPLATFIYAGVHWLADGDRLLGIRLVNLLQLLCGLLAAWLIYRISLLSFGHIASGKTLGSVAAAVWFCSDLTIMHTMNALETVFYCCSILLTLWWYLRHEQQLWGLRQRITFGFLLGVCFWWRIDAVLVALAFGLYHLGANRKAWIAKIKDMAIAASTMIVVASPWLIANYVRFDSIMPISGTSQQRTKGFTLKSDLGSIIVDTLTVAGPLIRTVSTANILAVFVVLVFCFYLYRSRAAGRLPHRTSLMIGLNLLLISSIWYGYIFGAPWFLTRYLFILALFFVVPLTFMVVVLGLPRLRFRSIHALILATALLLIVTESATITLTGHQSRGHREFSEWVRHHVPQDAWVGGQQSGMIGFFHDRTYNLDGKVDPYVLQAIQSKKLFEIIYERNIEFIVGWHQGMDWLGSNLNVYEFIEIGNSKMSYKTDVLEEELNLPAGKLSFFRRYLGQIYNRINDVSVLRNTSLPCRQVLHGNAGEGFCTQQVDL